MVVALGPGKFYGSSLPRPRIYNDIKFNSDRIDPPVSVLDPLMSWAGEAHWSMGGLNFHRHRLQGRIEGNVEKLRTQIEKSIKVKKPRSPKSIKRKFVSKSIEVSVKNKKYANSNRTEMIGRAESGESLSPPPAPVANKRRRRYVGLIDEDDDGEEAPVVRKLLVRKLSDEFERVANCGKNGGFEMGIVEAVGLRTRGRRMVIEGRLNGGSKGKKRLRKIGNLVQ